jgi:hypothetical protein
VIDTATLEGEVIAALTREIEAFARPLEGAYGRDVRSTTHSLVGGLAQHLTAPRPLRGAERERAQDYGRREVRVKQALEDLLSAYRVSARVAWRHVVARADGADVVVLAERLFGYFEDLGAAAAEGFAAEQAESAGEDARRRERLVDLLVRDPPVDAASLGSAAEAAAWTPPEAVRAVVVRARRPPPLPPGAISGHRGDLVAAFVPASATRRLLGVPAAAEAPVVGPAVPWVFAARSFTRAVRALDLRDQGLLPSGPLVTDDHLVALFLHADSGLAADLAARHLAPLGDERPATRAKLLATLDAWLAHQGHQGAVAHTLGVHQQTVRYRLRRLRELFGPALDDPAERFALGVALRVIAPVPA